MGVDAVPGRQGNHAGRFVFVSRAPVGPLGRYVESVWYARGRVPYVREKIAPMGSTVALFVLGDPLVQTPRNGAGDPFRADRGCLLGPHDGPVVNQPLGETYAVGIVTSPVGCEAIFGQRPLTLRGRVVDLETAWVPATVVRDVLIQLTDPDEMLDAVIDHLETRVNLSIPGVDRCERAVALLMADPTRAIAEIADELRVSHGHLDYEFTRLVGLTPRSLGRLLRLRVLLKALDVSGTVRWADLAHEMGWSDQSHFIRDFRRHTGVTPSQYVKAQRATFSPDDIGQAAGFVPER